MQPIWETMQEIVAEQFNRIQRKRVNTSQRRRGHKNNGDLDASKIAHNLTKRGTANRSTRWMSSGLRSYDGSSGTFFAVSDDTLCVTNVRPLRLGWRRKQGVSEKGLRGSAEMPAIR